MAMLNDRQIKALHKQGPGQHKDPVIPRLIFEVSKSGKSVSATLRYKSPETGKTRRPTLAKIGTLSLVEIHDKAHAWNALLDQPEPVDPELDEKRQAADAVEAKRSSLRGTVSQLIDLFEEDLKRRGKEHTARPACLRRDMVNCEDSIGDRQANEITVADLGDIIGRIERRGSSAQAQKTRSFMVGLWKFGLRLEGATYWSEHRNTFGLVRNVAEYTTPVENGVKAGKRALSASEWERFWSILDDSDLARDKVECLQIEMITGQRIQEVAKITKSSGEINWDEGRWYVPEENRGKDGEDAPQHVVPLTAWQLSFIKLAWDRAEGDQLFPHDNAKLYTDGLGQAVKRLAAAHDMEHLTPRDLRRTWKQRSDDDVPQLSDDIGNKIQGHDLGGVSKTNYQNSPLRWIREKTAGMQVMSDYLQKLAHAELADNVIELKQEA